MGEMRGKGEAIGLAKERKGTLSFLPSDGEEGFEREDPVERVISFGCVHNELTHWKRVALFDGCIQKVLRERTCLGARESPF